MDMDNDIIDFLKEKERRVEKLKEIIKDRAHTYYTNNIDSFRKNMVDDNLSEKEKEAALFGFAFTSGYLIALEENNINI